MKLIIVLTSYDELGDTRRKTGFWLQELSTVYYIFKDAGVEVTLASPKGGKPPLYLNSDAQDGLAEAATRFNGDIEAQSIFEKTGKLSDVSAEGFDAIFCLAGHGVLWDLSEDVDTVRLVQDFAYNDRPIGAVCHAPGVFMHAKGPDGKPLVFGKNVTGFSNTEEEILGWTKVIPFLIEDMLIANGGIYQKGADWASFVVTDGKLVTGQNPASSEEAARKLLELLRAGQKI